jgi:uncharacterized phage protein gp47/JayE
MTVFKSFNNIVLEMLQRLQLTQSSLDVKPGSVARDLFVDLQGQQVADIYDALRDISALQSIMNLTGQDLVNYGANYGVIKNSGTKASGTVVLTFRAIDLDFPIQSGSVVRSRSGMPFLTISTISISKSQANAYRANATRLRQQLNLVGITDEFAVEVSVEAQSQGSIGNISAYSITSHNIANVNSATNVTSFSSGTDLENDAAYRSRILATFAGTNVGTALGYRSVILSLAEAIDALVIEPGDPLMTRDGTVVTTDSDGNLIVSEPGTGGRVDIYVMGDNPQSGTDGFVYYDKSGRDDPTDSANNYVLGQSSLTASTNLTINSRRVATMNGTAQIPLQPISSIISVSGSSSSSNFVEQYLDEVGNLKGNYKLVKDTGYAGGSPFGLDKLSWTSDRINLTGEAGTKGSLNGIDGLLFTNVLEIPEIRQDVQVVNENSTISSSRDYVTVRHIPVRTVSRVFNLTTGERYVIVDQNPDGTESINYTGRIQISGRTLPTASDVLQVDYTWIFSFDPYIDYDNFDPRDSLDTAQDSVEWGYSNYIRDELLTTSLDAYNNLSVTTQYIVDRILSVNTFVSEAANVIASSGSRKAVQVSNAVINIQKITDTSAGNKEVYNTSLADGNFSNLLITLPSDTIAATGDVVQVVYNLTNIANVDGYSPASATNNIITLHPSNIVPPGTATLVNYVMDFFNIMPQTNISSMPISGNGFNSFVGVDGYQPVQNTFSGTTVVENKRRSPSNLIVTVSGIPTAGTIRAVGTTINKVDGILTALADNTIDLAPLIRTAEGLSDTATVPSSIYIARAILVNEVTLTVALEIESEDYEFDLTNYCLKSSKWDRAHSIELSSLGSTVIRLGQGSVNTDNPIVTGMHLRVVFYYAKESGYEDLFFSRNGSAITNRRFGYVSSVNRLSGMQDSGGTISGKAIIDSFNQPASNSTYETDYNYTAPKENERITINFEYNKLITDATEAIESKRPITSDVLVKAATEIELDVSASIIVTTAYKDKSETVKQDVSDNITATLSASALGTTLDASDIINNAYNVAGLDRITISRFNKANVTGTKLSITAEKNQYLAPGTVTVTTEDR